jgi:putative N6-adenine-specific DNA methylase
METEQYFAVTAPGLETFAAAELRQLGIVPQAAQAGDALGLAGEDSGGGVAFSGGREALYRANLQLRTASRVLVRLGSFAATEFAELRKKAAQLPWRRYLRPGQPVNLRVTCHKSRLYHSGAVAERVAAAIGDALGKPSELVKGETPAQLVVVRLLHDQCTISIDSSGELLHRRGYRLETAKAPLRETLAAGLLLASGWDRQSPLLDPFCGSGTIPIEGALLAAGLAPGRGREFAFMHWPGVQRSAWVGLLAGRTQPKPAVQSETAGFAQPACPPILASDRDAGAVRMAQANAARAGVADCIQFAQQAVSAIQPPAGPGWVVTNPPYGVRVSANKDLRNLYAQLGNVLRAQCPGWQVTILCSDRVLLGQTGLHLDTSLSLVNGGLRVLVARGVVPG